MSQPDPDTARLIDEEAEHAETTRDDPYPPGVIAQRRNRARSWVYSVRLSDDDIAEIHRPARAANVPARTLVKSWITQHIANARPTTTVDPALHDVIRTEVAAAVKAALADTHPSGRQKRLRAGHRFQPGGARSRASQTAKARVSR